MGNLSHIFFFHRDDETPSKVVDDMSPSAMEIPKTYKAAVYDKPGSISTKITELETPEPGPGEVLIKL
jgi:hypothetical protein